MQHYTLFLKKNEHMLLPSDSVNAECRKQAGLYTLDPDALMLFCATDLLYRADQSAAYLRYLSNLWGQAQA